MKIDLVKLRTLASIECVVGPEHESYRAQIDDATSVAWIEDQIDRGNVWAWCSVKVSVSYRGLTCDEHLGGCSYESEESFVTGSGYYDDMVKTALTELAGLLEKIGNDHDIWEHDSTYCFQCIVTPP